MGNLTTHSNPDASERPVLEAAVPDSDRLPERRGRRPRDRRSISRRGRTTASHRRRELAHDYALGLEHYLSRPEEPALTRAHELGRRALTDGLGVLEMATIHAQAMSAALKAPSAGKKRARLLANLEEFFIEALTPFEMAHRGFWETSVVLHRLNDVLEGQAKRISAALHDEAAQLLASVHLALADVASRLAPDRAQELQSARKLLDQIEQRLRNLAHELRPPILDDLGLVPALEFLADGVSKRRGFPVTVQASISGDLPATVETTLYRITQEALTNIAKHAKATEARVSVQQDERQIVCSIRDDGVGLDATALTAGKSSQGLGLREIQERTAALGGRVRLGPNEARGTELTVEIPLER
jgi:signal transduction histidine kinase